MAYFMVHDDWLPSGSQLFADYDTYHTTFPSSEEYNASILTPNDGYVTIHSSTASFDAMDYSRELDSFIEGKATILEDDTMMSVDQFCPEVLPGSPEMGHVTTVQLQQHIMRLEEAPDSVQYAENIGPTMVSSAGHHIVPDFLVEWKTCQPVSPTTADVGHGAMKFADQTVATVPEFEAVEDVMDLLKQLSDTVDGDIYIDPAKLEAFVSFPFDPVSPDDVESLISSSQLSTIDTRVANLSSPSFHEDIDAAVAVPSSPASSESYTAVGSPCDEPVVEKKRKKQDQNKSAALRYRQKKRDEHGTVMSECEELERRNIELKTKVSEMMKEVEYLKGLIEEICT